MSYKIETIAPFAKRPKSSLKNIHFYKNELAELGSQLSTDPTTGTAFGNNCYNILLAILSKGKGNSGGARVITHFYVSDETVFLLSIYDKSDKKNISDKELLELLKKIQ